MKECDEIWHAGDIGDIHVTDQLSKIAPLRAVHGNIDGGDVRITFPKDLKFIIEGQKVWITHIGGRPPRFAPGILSELITYRPDIFICGHSHILIAQGCPSFGGLHLNPGAAGIYGNRTPPTTFLPPPTRKCLRDPLDGGGTRNAQFSKES